MRRCAVEETGTNSVSPWMTPRSAAVSTIAGRLAYEARRRVGLRAGAAAAAGAAAIAFTGFFPCQISDDRRRNEDTRVRAGDDADEHREGKAMEHLAAEQIESQNAEERRACRNDGAAEGLVDRDVDDLLQAVAPHAAHVLAHAVEDDDGVVGRVAGDRQDRGDHVQREVVPEEGQERQRHQQVVYGRDHGADGEAELEPHGDVDQDAAEREHGGERPLPRQLLADTRTDDLGAGHLELPEIRFVQGRGDGIGRLAQAAARLLADHGHADHQLSRRRIAVPIDDRVLPDARHRLIQRGANLLAVRQLIEADDDDRAAGELDAERHAETPNRHQARENDDPGQCDRVPSPADEIEIRMMEDLHDVCLYRGFAAPPSPSLAGAPCPAPLRRAAQPIKY